MLRASSHIAIKKERVSQIKMWIISGVTAEKGNFIGRRRTWQKLHGGLPNKLKTVKPNE